LLDLLTARGSRLGGNSGQMLLRFVGRDGFVTPKDIAACLRAVGATDATRDHEIHFAGTFVRSTRSGTEPGDTGAGNTRSGQKLGSSHETDVTERSSS
jgi:hypothetical protein